MRNEEEKEQMITETTQFIRENSDSGSTLKRRFGIDISNAQDVQRMFYDTKGLAFKAYTNLITENMGLDEEEKKKFDTLAEQSAVAFISEASADTQIVQYAPFQLLVLREITIRRISGKLITTSAINVLKTTISIWKTYLIDKDNVKHDLNTIDDESVIERGWIEAVIDVDAIYASLDDANLTSDIDKAVPVDNRRLDKDFKIISVHFADADVDVPVNVTWVERGSINAKVEYVDPAGIDDVEETLIGIVDLDSGIVKVGTLNEAVDKVTIRYRMANVYNETNDMTLTMEYVPDYEITIGDGDSINLGLPMNYLEDTKALTDTDGLTKAVSKMAYAFSRIQDVDVLKDLKASVTAENTLNWTSTPPDGIDVITHNKSMLFEVAKCIALADSKHEFSSIYKHNIAMNTTNAVYLNSPLLINNSKPSNISITGGSYNFNTTSALVGGGKVEIHTSKMIAPNTSIIVPMASDREERVAHMYQYSSVLTNNKYGNRNTPLIPNICAKERKTFEIHSPQVITSLTISE